MSCSAVDRAVSAALGSAAAEASAEAEARVKPRATAPLEGSAAAKVTKHLKVPVHDKPVAALIEKALPPLEVSAKETEKKIRVKTIRHTDCIEVGHDKFDEFVTNFLIKIGESNIISINALTYTHLDIGSQKLMTDYAVMVVYRG